MPHSCYQIMETQFLHSPHLSSHFWKKRLYCFENFGQSLEKPWFKGRLGVRNFLPAYNYSKKKFHHKTSFHDPSSTVFKRELENSWFGGFKAVFDFSDSRVNWMHESWHVIMHERVGVHQELLGKTKKNVLHSVDLSMVVLHFFLLFSWT